MTLPSASMKATKSTASTKLTSSKSADGKGLDNDVWTLFFAAHPSIIPNVRAMAAVDEKGRTASQMEYQLRKHRHAGKELAEKKAGILEGLMKNDGVKKRKSASEEGGKTGTAKTGKADVETDDVEEDDTPVKKPKILKKGTAKIVKKGSTGGTKPKAYPKANPRMNKKAKRSKELEQAEDASGEEEEGDNGVGDEDGDLDEDDNGMVEMEFEH